MNYKNMTKKQLVDELAKLRQKNMELELILKDKECLSTAPESSSPNRWFSTGRAELFVCKSSEQEEIDNSKKKYKFSDLVDIPLLQQFLKSLYEATGLPHALVDIDNNILSGIGWQDICSRFHRACPQSSCRCKESDSYISAHLHDGPYVGYKCLNGLMDYATPIIVEGEHLATVFIGQLLHQPPDEEYFSSQAREYGFDENAYLEALCRVPVIPEEQIETIMKFYIQLGQFLASIGLNRKRQIELAKQAIRKQEERFRLLWETSNDGFWEWNIEAGKVYYSPRWAEMLGYSFEDCEVDIQNWEKRLHPDDISTAMEAINEHLQERTTVYAAEYRIITESGEEKWILDHGQLVARNAEGQPLTMVGASIDITAFKKVEASLFESQQKFATVFYSSPDIMTISTIKDGRYVEVNDAFVAITGYERNEVIGRCVFDLNIWVVPEERDAVIKQIQENGRVRDFEIELRSKYGETGISLLSGEIVDLGGEEYLITTNRDITERKQMEEALRLSEECLFKAFNTSPIIMAITTLEEGMFIKANKAFACIVGYDHEEVIGRTSLEIGFWLNPLERDLLKQSIVAGQSVRDMEIVFGNIYGEQKLGLLSAEGLDIDGKPCLLSVLTDITELRRMEVEMTRLDRLNLVGEMAASIGHEIRNPMTTVRGYLQIMRENKDNIQELEYFNLMIEELDRANAIITDFLSLAKNKMVDMKPGDLNAIINKLLPLIQAKALSRDQYIKLELGEIPYLLLDNKEVHQLILNLVNNGLESMSLPGYVTIKTYMEDEAVVLAVQDQGQGIDPSLLDKLGTPFLTTKDNGTGLGLAVCYRIAEQHNAKIDVETSINGSTFYLKFPGETGEEPMV